MTVSDDRIADVLRTTRVIACVGYSPNPARASCSVSAFLKDRGYRVIPVNPLHAGEMALGERIAGHLSELSGEGVDMVDIFRRPEYISGVVDDAIRVLPELRTIWMQLGLRHAAAAARATAKGVTVIQDRCPKIEMARLHV